MAWIKSTGNIRKHDLPVGLFSHAANGKFCASPGTQSRSPGQHVPSRPSPKRLDLDVQVLFIFSSARIYSINRSVNFKMAKMAWPTFHLLGPTDSILWPSNMAMAHSRHKPSFKGNAHFSLSLSFPLSFFSLPLSLPLFKIDPFPWYWTPARNDGLVGELHLFGAFNMSGRD